MARAVGVAALLLAFGAAAWIGPPARGQAIEWLAEQDGVTLLRNTGSARLDAMGGLEIAIPDEDRELNLSDYGRNVCGILTDSDYRRWDYWQRSSSMIHDVRDVTGLRTRTRSDLVEAGGRMSWLNGTSRVIGGEFSYDQLRSSLERGPNSKIRGPLWGAFAAQRIGRITLGGSAHRIGDNEDLRSESIFAIRHESSGDRGVGALALDLGTIEVGGQAELQSNTIRGISRDESRFHEDKYTWKRPVHIYTGSMFWRPLEIVTGAARVRVTRLKGREEVKVSWSDRMPNNPSHINLIDRVGTFDEKVDGVEFGTRWEAHPWTPVTLAALAERSKVDDSVVEGKNYKGSRRATDTTDRRVRASLGASYSHPDARFRVGVEGWYMRDENESTVIDETTTIKGRRLELRSGGEWFVRESLALRAGFLRVAYDTNLDQPHSLQTGNGYTIGIGFLPRGGLYQLDAAVRVLNLDPDYSGVPNSEDSGTSVSLGVRFLL